MSKKTIQNIIIKYLTNSANANELDLLQNWIEAPLNEQMFKEFVKIHYAVVYMNNPNQDKIKKRLQREIRMDKTFVLRKRFRTVLKYAAIAILLISTGYFLTNVQFISSGDQPIIVKEKSITLESESGEIIVISKENDGKILKSNGQVVGIQKGDKLLYNYDENGIEKIVYNTLNIPYGKRYNLVLSDGTLVHLNSGSKLKYPVKFIKGEERLVFLEGEAFFDVAHDKQHPFKVEAEELSIQVLGTKFNLSNYTEDGYTDVVLTNGSVNLEYGAGTNDEKKVILKPGFKGSFNKTDKTIFTKKVNTAIYTSWLNGNLVFRNAPFDIIIKRLERKYNVIIINNNEKLLGETFNATIEVDKENIVQVFEYFKRIHDIQYQVFDNKIIIN
ncbi:FecR family protein [Flavivirga eckloniae]|uniref:Iron dicitrate transport regulator FecR n=1 Tax=Flavivirga eckloniae TaxID=1803846 RepID=A0A2K9PW11_9FLAO|nr:FecR family protein [Flavivirga eckloniae]AUP81255.1 iron dicitrate transport regulator FecR [Flavivirga eckloniae]